MFNEQWTMSNSRSLIKRWPSYHRSCKTLWRRRKTLCFTGMKRKSIILVLQDFISGAEAYTCAIFFNTDEWGINLLSYSVASAGPSSEEDSMEHMELETRGIEMDSSNPSYKRQGQNSPLPLELNDQKANAHPISFTRCHLCVRIFSTKANLSSHIRFRKAHWQHLIWIHN